MMLNQNDIKYIFQMFFYHLLLCLKKRFLNRFHQQNDYFISAFSQ